MLNQFKDNIKHIVLTLLLILILSHFIFFLSQINNFKSNYLNALQIDSIVVLTGDRFRISTGVEIFSKGVGEKLLLSGVNKDINTDNIKKKFPKYTDLFNCCIEIDNISSNTFENSRETFLWLKKYKYDSVLIVSSDYHMPRVKLEFERFMDKNDIYYHPVERNGEMSILKKTKKIFLEYIKYVRTYISIVVGL